MRMRLIFLAAAFASISAIWLAAAGCNNCSYATRLVWDPSCRNVGGPNVSVSPLPRPITAAPKTGANAFSVKVSVNCPPGQATLCNHFSNQAPYFAVLLQPDKNNPPTYTSAAGTVYPNCAAFWADFATNPNPPFAAQDILGIFVGDTITNFVTCDDVAGCQAAPQFLTNFNPASSFRTDGLGVTVPAGQYQLCAFIDSWNLPSTTQAGYFGFPYPLGSATVPWTFNDFLTIGCQVDQNCQLPAPCATAGTCASGNGAPIAGSAGQAFVGVNVSSNTTISLNLWSDSP